MLTKVVTDVRSIESLLALLHNYNYNEPKKVLFVEYGQNSKEAPKT